ncbi:UDP-glucose/GDP-mannose dehydrogenase family protein [Bacillus mojavensis]|uniref:UDP-glucose dehydrogenase family protein n=1 Tax=Bacillus mojavensis TaxID=72360 RepID=UPI002DBCB817|nr:UDP-glucose/GDP-mannose dehydrogenase family protein [Bacillus mojavensis]MEC1681118.1 UDP-glucose/GDP-mannose dehydrogenase family protein [Bacillus mojavensis]MEC1687931.1 UDP-glucose/GDP-mannose dehydrogenase family protein [Bacillus mojavensis]MEC1711956.1 UDP-glucose/GDP-mannose dehydrogenase family protein [Bacillus mojavensis]
MNITVIGTGYVGLVTGVSLSEIGHHVTCIDINAQKIEEMRKGISPIFEPGLEELMRKNIADGRLSFETSYEKGLDQAEIIFIAVGTPQKNDGHANLEHITDVAKRIARHVTRDTIVVTKSTVPVGTNDWIYELITKHLAEPVSISIASNPEFLREGSAIHDTFHGDRIVIGTADQDTARTLEELFHPLDIPIYQTDIRSAEMIKYASNAFLATKISFINEISNICEKVGADIESVAYGMGQDKRIGSQFLKAGIGYGGSCFPKDTNALVQIAGNVEHDFELLKSVIKVNNNQQAMLVDKALNRLGGVTGKTITLLGLSFKPNTDDMRDAPSIVIANRLAALDAHIKAFDPIAVSHAKHILPQAVEYKKTMAEAVKGSDAVMILTDWDEIKQFPLADYQDLMEQPLIFDGRNCYSLEEAAAAGVEYYSVGRKAVVPAGAMS